jgi:DNA-binding transcriptional regulator YdaS (Cro superfamily)
MDGMQLIRAHPGLLAKVARDLGISRPAVAKWRRVPAERLPEIEASTGIPRHLLRPDICFAPCPHEGRRPVECA